ISRVFYIIKNAWWATFGLYIVIYLIEVFIAMVFYIPTYVIQWLTLIIPFRRGAETYNETGQAIEGITTAWQWTAIYMPLYFFGVLLATSLIVVAVALKYFSLVEQKEGGGELEKISQIGT
ncbi:MAG: hypothetical protein IIA45_15200, partial [Bacteroidetes bacterium]|nr:hypothetical protein [Bacteroidota bacterium]